MYLKLKLLKYNESPGIVFPNWKNILIYNFEKFAKYFGVK